MRGKNLPMSVKPTLAMCVLLCGPLAAQVSVTEIKLYTDPAELRLRPLEHLVIQVRAYGKVGEATGRIRRDGATVKVADPNGGWLSKTFKFQGQESEPFLDQFQSRAGRIFGQLKGEYVLQDSFLYTAPEKPGEYRIEATLDGKTAEITIHVDANAPARRRPEKHTFGPLGISLDPYRDLAEHYAPLLAQETWFDPKADYPTRFDYDGDWDGSNNWDSLEEGTSQAYVYYTAMETPTHWFLVYNVFHPRDYSDKCVAGSCHENDNEGLILAIAKDGSQYGRLQVMETLAHNNIYSYTADSRIRGGVHSINGPIELYQESHPVVFIESGGHGIYGSRSSHSRYDLEKDEFSAGTGATFIYKGVAERPKHPNDRLVGYELLPIYTEWWTKANRDSGWNERTFDAFFAYQPVGRRPGVPYPEIAGSFFGRKFGANMAKPFWGWHDTRTRKRGVLAVGQWALDPAYSVSQNLTFPVSDRVSLDYVFNPYLKLEHQQLSETAAQTVPSAPAPAPQSSSQGWFEFRVWIDGSVEAFVRGDRIRYEVLSGAPFQDPSISYSEPLPAAPLRSLRLVKQEGRGQVQLVEQPSEGNGYTVRVRIDDPARAGAVYRVRLEWER
jgi:hypothetical protein